MSLIRAYLGLGANLGDPLAQLRQAADRLAATTDIRPAGRSRVYETDPWGEADQPPFLNAALAVDTSLTPEDLLDRCLAVEREGGRQRDGRRWGPRLIDVDVLLYDAVCRAAPDPVLPHPRLHQRAFALRPLLDLDPELMIPGRGRAADLLADLGGAGVRACDRQW